ncbi:TadE/TadG family type IV pilus assembly protein [Actinoplanes sp. NPDC026619]|uniref:TadE/TadG family type IV pilus assembly protein n=1 Tax=Actinoplanes sp. NPDC026619 TaxID=3155798 RepID=UPI0033F21F01
MELALVLPILLLLIFGLVDFGRVMQQQIQLTEAVREGARVGALNGTVSDMQTQVSSTVGSGIVLTYPTTTPCPASATTANDATVTVSRAFDPITPLYAVLKLFTSTAPSAITLSATGVMACLG